MRPILVWVTVAYLLAVATSPLRAQVGAGQVTGRVADPGGAVVPGATVSATSVDTGASRRTVSSSAVGFVHARSFR